MRVQLIDPSADVLPYDHALAGALARRGAERGAGHVALRARARARRPTATQVERVLLPARHRPGRAAPAAAPGAQARRARARHAAGAPPRRRRRPAALAVALAGGRERAPAAARPPAGAHHAQRDPARALRPAARRAHGRRDRPHPPRRRAARRRPARARDPARRVRPPHPPVRASGRCRRSWRRSRGRSCCASGSCARTRASTCWSTRSARSQGAELWVVGRPLGVSLEALDAPPNVRFVPRYVQRRRAARLLPPRRPAGAPPPHRWTCRACCSPASPSASRWCSPTWAASARWSRSTAPAGWSRRATRGALATAIGELLADPAERERAGRARPGGGRGPVLVGLGRAAHAGGLRGGARAVRVVFMGKSKRSAVRALDWLVERGVDVAAVVAPEPDEPDARPTSASTWPRAATASRSRARPSSTPTRPPTWTWSSRSCSGT